ncbi:MAG: hypothetical protein NC191_10020 [Muribaculaceae bacterium]|nr:hypothetical protein [Muribaculaceae bacterium]
MQGKKIPSLKIRDDFVSWLFEEFKVPESKQLDIKGRSNEVPDNWDFMYLAECVKEKYISRNTLPSSTWLKMRLIEREEAQRQKNHIPATFGGTCEAIQNAKESNNYFKANYKECQNAMKACMAHYETITGRKLRRGEQCT